MEMDCSEVVDLWSARYNSRSIVAPILDDVRELSSSFISFSVKHVKREANKAADRCAKQACSLTGSDCWLRDCPPFLISNLLTDCNRMSVNQ